MDGLLIVSAAEPARTRLLEQSGRYSLPTHTAATAGEARRSTLDHAFSIALIDTPLPDEFGNELAYFLSEKGSDALLLVKAEIAVEVSVQAARTGVYVLGKPLQPDILHQTLRVMFTARARIRALQEENESLRRRIDEIKLIERAKARLIERRHVTEAQAHRYIEKQAMDQRVSKAHIAERILKLLT